MAFRRYYRRAYRKRSYRRRSTGYRYRRFRRFTVKPYYKLLEQTAGGGVGRSLLPKPGYVKLIAPGASGKSKFLKLDKFIAEQWPGFAIQQFDGQKYGRYLAQWSRTPAA